MDSKLRSLTDYRLNVTSRNEQPAVRIAPPSDAPKPKLVVVRAGKGDKDRYTMLPAAVKKLLWTHLQAVKRQHDEDLRRGMGRVALPDALARKYPNAEQEWGWQWVFPATSHYTDRVSGARRRHHLHESVVQKAFKEARFKAGMFKPATCHTLRHSFATQASPWLAYGTARASPRRRRRLKGKQRRRPHVLQAGTKRACATSSLITSRRRGKRRSALTAIG